MTRLSERLIEWSLLATMVAVAALLCHTSAFGALEPFGCVNNQCKQILYYDQCPGGVSLQASDCLECAVSGRCNNAVVKQCKQTINPQALHTAVVVDVCDCTKAPANGSVEASGTYGGPWNPSSVNVYVCLQ
jgi:hypothetical protein